MLIRLRDIEPYNDTGKDPGDSKRFFKRLSGKETFEFNGKEIPQCLLVNSLTYKETSGLNSARGILLSIGLDSYFDKLDSGLKKEALIEQYGVGEIEINFRAEDYPANPEIKVSARVPADADTQKNVDLDKLYTTCPFCSKSIHVKEYTHPARWECPVCHAIDTEWNFLLNCANCGYSHRTIECPHCKEDFDSMRFMGAFASSYMDFMSIQKYKGPQSSYAPKDLNHAFCLNPEIGKDAEAATINMISDTRFNFPGEPQQIKVLEIYNIQKDKSSENKFWICAYLYDRLKIARNEDIGQVVFVFIPGSRVEAKTVDVSRNFLYREEKRKRELDGRKERTISTDPLEKEIFRKLSQIVQKPSLTNEEREEAIRIIKDMGKSVFNCLEKLFQENVQVPAEIWGFAEKLADGIRKLDLAEKEMPWYGDPLNEPRKKSVEALNRYITSAYYNHAVKEGESGRPKTARHSYKMAALFHPEPPLAVMMHNNWALMINQINHNFETPDSSKAYENVAEFLEMVAHYDEVIQQYGLITDDEWKRSLKKIEEDARAFVQKAIQLQGVNLCYSNSLNGQLVMKSKDGASETPVKITWTEFDFEKKDGDNQQTEAFKTSCEFSWRGMEYLGKRMLDEAISEFKEALKYDPENIDALVNLGTALQWKGLFDDAIGMFEKGLKIAASDEAKETIFFNIGNAYKAQEKFEEAIVFYRKALEINSGKDTRHFNLGQCYLALMQMDLAIAEYEAALKINPHHANARKNLEAARMAKEAGMGKDKIGATEARGAEVSKEIKQAAPFPAVKRKNMALIGVIITAILAVLGYTFYPKTPEVKVIPKIGYTEMTVNLRTGPGVENTIVGSLTKNSKVILVESRRAKNGALWYQIKVEGGPLDGKIGFINQKYIKMQGTK